MLGKTIILALASAAAAKTFVHPGALHTAADFERIRTHVSAETQPWYDGWKLLEASGYSKLSYTPNPYAVVYRGSDGVASHTENYYSLYYDLAAAYQLALRWKIAEDDAYAEASINILNKWSAKLTGIGGSNDMYLAAGLYGYQMANVGEIMRAYSGWSWTDQEALGTVLKTVFATMNMDFLENHAGAGEKVFYANWDQCNIASLIAIGIFTDDSAYYDYGVEYFKTGAAEGALPHFIIANYTEESTGKILAQGQEAGRDQGHATLDSMLLGVIAQQAYNQGDDLFALYDNSILNAVEYTAKYNVGYNVPYTDFDAYTGLQTEISSTDREVVRPGYELLTSHYGDLKGLDCSWSNSYRDMVNANNTDYVVEGGGGNYGMGSSGFDSLGFGTLMFRLKVD